MSLGVTDIVNRVRAVIDELAANDSGFLTQSEDEANLTNVIKDKIGDALMWVLEHAPVEKLDAESITGVGSYVSGSFSIDSTTLMGQAQLPTDVLRVVSARLSSWKQSPVPVTERSDVYLMQSDDYAKGSWDRPVVAIVHRISSGVTPTVQRWVELYSAKETSDTLHLLVYKKPVLTNIATNGVDVPSVLEGAFIYYIAGLTMTAFKDDVASALFAIAKEHLGATD